ncbi:MAG: phage virion morphogenesis protein [Elusimicrobiaceae bacterium]|jgi:phage gpG-like protein
MDAKNINIELSPESKDLLKRLGDVDLIRLRNVLEGIGNDFRQSMKGFFSTPGTSRWDDLKDSTKKQKQHLFGRVYPIMVGSGRLAESFYNKAHAENVNRVTETAAEFGTGVYYASFHEYGTRRMAQRQLITHDEVQFRRWRRIINNYFVKMFKRNGIDVKGDIV